MRHAVAVALFSVAFSAFGHGGEDHGAPPPAVTQTVEPRDAAATEEFEVVTALEGKKLVVYVDRFGSNEPVAQAKVEIEGAGLKGMASETTPGTYALDVPTPLPPAKHALTISIETGESADLLSVTLDISPPPIDVEHAHGWSEWLVWMSAGLLGLAGGTLWTIRRRKQSKGVK